jgi:predicted RNA-binding protein
MCLSTVYLDKKDQEHVFLEEASSITVEGGLVRVSTLFGEQKTAAGYVPGEVNLLEHFVVLTRNGAAHDGRQ